MPSKKNKSEACQCCDCDPCDCHGVNDELWGMDKTECDQGRQDTCMVSKADRDQPKSGQQVEERKHSKNSVLLEDLQRDCETARAASPGSHPRRGFLYWGFF